MISQKIKCFGTMLLFAVSLSSCLKSGLDELPAFTEAAITDVFFQYRFKDPVEKNPDGSEKVRIVTLSVSDKKFLKKEDTGAATDSVTAVVTVPDASAFDPETERNNVTASNLVCMTNISTAAKVSGVDEAPRMGAPGDFSQPRQYRVVAADGRTERIWTINITLIK